jgi:SRSO17 transposase
MATPLDIDPEIDDAVTPEDLREWNKEFKEISKRIAGLFYRPESRRHAEQYLQGLLKPIERKNAWTIAPEVGEKEPKAIQRFLNLTPWDEGKLRDIVRDYVTEHFGDPRGVLIADPTGFPKKGSKSAGVQRQYSGTLGRIDNCQIGTFLAYVNTSKERTLIDRELYIPKKTWLADPDRCAEAGIPANLAFATRPQQVAAMIDRAVEGGVPFSWFTADEEFGQNPGLRDHLEQRDIAYVMAIPKNTEIAGSDGQDTEIQEAAQNLSRTAWQRHACGIGAKGFRSYDWALIASDHPSHQYMIRRSLDDGELAYYHCFNPRHEHLLELIRVAGSRWPVEECFEAEKSEVGLDQYQVRLYHAWYRHVTLAMLAHAFLTLCTRKRATAKKGLHTLWTTSRQ